MLRQDDALIAVADGHMVVGTADFERGAIFLNKCPVVQLVANAFDERLKGDEIEHDAGGIQIPFRDDGDLIIMAVKRLTVAVGEDEKMRRREIEIILIHLDRKPAQHAKTVTEMPDLGKGEARDGGIRRSCLSLASVPRVGRYFAWRFNAAGGILRPFFYESLFCL